MAGVPPPSEEQVAKELEVLRLRRAGMSFTEIAQRTGYADRGGAYKAYKAAMNRTYKEPVHEVRELEADRLDALQVSVWAAAMRGNLGAVDRVLRISERRARLLGLDHADGIAERMVQLEADKVRLIALAVGKMLDSLELTEQQRQAATRLFLAELRSQAIERDDDGDDGAAGVLVPAS